MTASLLPAFSPSQAPSPLAAERRAAQEQPEAFGNLLAAKDKPRPRPAFPEKGVPAAGRHVAHPEPAPEGSEASSAPQPALDGEGADEADALPAEAGEEKKEAPPEWLAGMQPVAAAPAPVPRQPSPPESEAAASSPADPKGGSQTEAAAQPSPGEIDPRLQAAASALRQRLRDVGGTQPVANAGAVLAPTPTTLEKQAEAVPQQPAPDRRLRAAAASLGLFRSASPVANGEGEAAPEEHVAKSGAHAPAEMAEAKNGKAAPQAGGLPLQVFQPANFPVGGEAGAPAVAPRDFASHLAASAAAPASIPALAAQQERILPANRLQVLEVKLRPAELGTVTARMRITDQQLSVEITADSALGRDSLTAQEGTIRASLEALGFRVDRLTIQHLPAANPGQTSAGSPSGAQADGAFGGASGAGGGSAGQSGKGAGDGNGKKASGEAGLAVGAASGSGRGSPGVFI